MNERSTGFGMYALGFILKTLCFALGAARVCTFKPTPSLYTGVSARCVLGMSYRQVSGKSLLKSSPFSRHRDDHGLFRGALPLVKLEVPPWSQLNNDQNQQAAAAWQTNIRLTSVNILALLLPLFTYPCRETIRKAS